MMVARLALACPQWAFEPAAAGCSLTERTMRQQSVGIDAHRSGVGRTAATRAITRWPELGLVHFPTVSEQLPVAPDLAPAAM